MGPGITNYRRNKATPQAGIDVSVTIGLGPGILHNPPRRNLTSGGLLIDVVAARLIPGDSGVELVFNIPDKLRIRPHLIAPLNGSVHRLGAPVMLWTETVEAIYYEVHVARDIDFTDRIGRFDVLGGQFQYGWPFGGIYYWRVRAVAPPAYSDYSEVWSFTVPPLLPDQVSTHDGDGRARLLNQFQENE